MVRSLFTALAVFTTSSAGTFHRTVCGGGICGLTVAFEGLARRVVLVEQDENVAAVWQTMLSEDAYALSARILSFDMTAQKVDEVLSNSPSSTDECAFQTLVRNRVNRGGILAQGVGKMKLGENGKGLTSRWYPETLARRIMAIYQHREHIDFIQTDGMQVIDQYQNDERAVFFVDPPYTVGHKRAGSRLYTHFELNHEHLFSLMAATTGDFIMTYDNDSEVKHLAEGEDFSYREIAMRNTRHARMTELVMGRNLNWLTSP